MRDENTSYLLWPVYYEFSVQFFSTKFVNSVEPLPTTDFQSKAGFEFFRYFVIPNCFSHFSRLSDKRNRNAFVGGTWGGGLNKRL